MRPSLTALVGALDSSILAIAPDQYASFRSSLLKADSSLLAETPRLTPRIAGQIAVIRLTGFILHHEGIDRWCSWLTSAEGFARAIDEAIGNPDVGAIVIDCDSNGGTVEGVPECADRLFAARGKGKKIVAVVNAHMNSAAYFIASQADEIVVTPSGECGSIGVYTTHYDFSRADEKFGIKRTVIAAGKYKAEGVDEPLSDDAQRALQARVEAVYDLFVAAVSRGRGVKEDEVRNGFGEGRVLPARAAVTAGLANRIGTLDQVLLELAGKAVPATNGRARAEASAAGGIDHQSFDLAVLSSPLVAGVARTLNMDALTFAMHAARITADRTESTECPDCGAEMVTVDGELQCPDCTEDVTDTPPPQDTEASAPNTNLTAGGGTTVIALPIPASQPAPQARSHSVTPEELAAQRAAAADEARKAETKRINDIRATCAQHEIGAAQMDQWINAGADILDVERAIFAQKRQERAAEATVRVGATREEQKPWETLGHFASAVMAAGDPSRKGPMDARLHAAAQGVNQAVPSEGGFLVPPQFSTKIWDGMANQADDFVGMTDSYPIDGESLTLPANGETSRATGSRFGGVKGYWMNEADQVTKSKPKVRQMRLEPQELGVLIYATDKSLRNSPIALGTFLDRAASEEVTFVSNDALYRGNGAGQPLGLMNSGSLITVNKEASQPNGTILQENISKMWARLHPRARAAAVWLMNVDCEPQLDFLNTVVKNVAGTENVGGYANKVYDAEKRTIKGRPIITAEYCESLGTKGDIALVNWGWYATGLRSSGVRKDTSMHLRFDYNETAFRFMYEIDGQPWLADPLTPYKGSNTLSWAIVLQAR